ncbi:GOLPH3/VPS74 family protein [Luteipulveratus halotolerans]|uniref:GPP34 family phosphoprotein n=1 Tax=Luteipulveratus halotolerans TaxID=1631356 RepID=A0A0L6CEY1_9MICO|nr:GPP34 family phosphoprotein [Luteipulveratus halotolerans]KNX36053.1 hypothetical protein VV01_01025 [Luteipulveratus halotolerans]
MLIAEDLLLQLTAADGRLIAAGNKIDLGLAGALLSELALLEKVTVDDRGRLLVRDARPVGNPHLDAALAHFVAKQGKKPKDALGKVAKGLRGRLYDGLAVEGAVRAERSTFLGIFPRTTWPVLDRHAQEATRDALLRELLGSAPVEPRGATLISLVHAIDAVPAVFPDAGGLPKRDLKKRAKAVADGSWAGAAVGKAIAQTQAAVNAAITAAIVSSAAGGAVSS